MGLNLQYNCTFVLLLMPIYNLSSYSNFDSASWNSLMHGSNRLSIDSMSQLIRNVTCGNDIYNVSDSLLEAFVGQLEVEAPSPYNSVPYNFRLVQLLEEGRTGNVPVLPPKLLLNEEGRNIILSNNTLMLRKWVTRYSEQNSSPFKDTTILRSNGPINIIRSDLGTEHIIHASKLYDSWSDHKELHPITLVISNTNFTRTKELVVSLEEKRHPFTEVIIMASYGDIEGELSQGSKATFLERGTCHELCLQDINEKLNNLTNGTLPILFQERQVGYAEGISPELMDKCYATPSSDWFIIIDSYLDLRDDANLLVVPPRVLDGIAKTANKRGRNSKPFEDISPGLHILVPFRPASYKIALQYPHLNAIYRRMRSFHHLATLRHFGEGSDIYLGDRLFSEWDVPYHVHLRNSFCDEWMQIFGGEGEWIEGEPGGPTASDYMAYVNTELLTNYRTPYKMSDITLHTTYSPFVLLNDNKEERQKRHDGTK